MNAILPSLSCLLLAGSVGAAIAGSPINETRAVDADARIEVSNVRGSVTVSTWDRNEVAVTGTLGSGSASLANVLGNPVATLGAGLVLPFLKFGEMQRNTAIAQSSYEQAIISFRKTLYSALADVENALSNRTQLQTQEARLTESLAQARRAEELTRIRYRAGAVAMKIWLDAQETRRTAEMALLDVQLNRADNLVTTYQALGGAPVLQAVPVGGPAR